MLNSGGNSSSSPAAECFMTILNTSGTTSDISKRKNCRSKRRFSDDQIRSLEIMFETKTKLEPRRKLQLARELELQPRQVAVWFQNKRARWKSKQLERDYSLLCSHYNNLASQFESLEKEKRSLLEQLQRLNDLIGKSEKEGEELYNCRHEASAAEPGNGAGPVVVISNDIGAGNVESCTRDQKLIDDKQSLYFERSAYGSVIGDQVLSDDDDDDDDKSSRTNNPDFPGFEEEETQLSNRAEPADTSLTSPAEWNRLDSNALLEDQPSSSYKWWDFWS